MSVVEKEDKFREATNYRDNLSCDQLLIMRSVTWFIVSYTIMFLVLRGGKGDKLVFCMLLR